MRVAVKVNAKAEDIFSVFVESLNQEIKLIVPDFKPKQLIKGYYYKKNMNPKKDSNQIVNVVIDKISLQDGYAATFTGTQGINTISYEFLPNGDQTTVIYREEFIGNSKMNQWYSQFANFLFLRRHQKRIKTTMYRIENYIKQQQKSNQ